MKSPCFFLIGLCFWIVSCHSSLQSEVQFLQSSVISFPEELYSLNGNLFELDTLNDTPARIVIWFDSTGCNRCKALDVYSYGFVYDYCRDSLNMNCDFTIIFSPSEDQLESVMCFIWERNIDIPIFIDVNNQFGMMNDFIPSDYKFHAFLLNDSNKIVLIGPPNYNKPMWNLYKEMISDLFDSHM